MAETDEANWQLQLEELVAVKSILGGEDVRLLQLEGADHQCLEGEEDPVALLTELQPTAPGVCSGEGGGSEAGPSSSAATESKGAACTVSAWFCCEACVHVELPPAGIQLMRVPAPEQSRSSTATSTGNPHEGASDAIAEEASGSCSEPQQQTQQQQSQQQQGKGETEQPLPSEGNAQHQRHRRRRWSHKQQQMPQAQVQQAQDSQQQDTEQQHQQQQQQQAPSQPPNEPSTQTDTFEAHAPTPIGRPLSHLPPLLIHLTLPTSYPSTTPPHIQQLSAMWLSEEQAQALAQQWIDEEPWQEGTPCLYEWLEKLQSSALQRLGICSNTQASPPNTPIPLILPPEKHDMGGSIVRYADCRARLVFESSTCLCNICFEETLGAKFVRLDGCEHAFCKTCMSTYFKTKLASGEVEGMCCPDPTCKQPVAPAELKSLLSLDEFAKWERLLLQRTLDKMEDVVYCPRCEQLAIQDKDHCAECPNCMYCFCGLCLGSWHPGVGCLSDEERVMLMQRRALNRAAGDGDTRKDAESIRWRLERDCIDQIKSLQLIKKTTKRCPGCSADIERSEGCNKMKCTYCYTAFCYRCGKEVQDYDHFGANSCPIFDREEVERMLMYEQRPAFDIRANRELAVDLAPCVVCGQVNLREGRNNLIRCYACRQSFCFACRQWLRTKPGMHFGATSTNKCRQHG